MLVVSDAGPLIAFLDADAIDVLLLRYQTIIIPPIVHDEVFRRRPRVKPSQIKIQDIDDAAALRRFTEYRQSLDGGEAQAVALAEHLHAVVLIDEVAGTRVANECGIQCASTIDVLKHLVNEGHLKRKRAQRIVEIMRLNGTYLPAERFTA